MSVPASDSLDAQVNHYTGYGTRTLSATGLPSGFSIAGDQLQGVASASGTFDYTLITTDELGRSDTVDCQINVACVPTGAESCDGLDNDCNGLTDDNITAVEECNNADDDCNGLVDDNITADASCGSCAITTIPSSCQGGQTIPCEANQFTLGALGDAALSLNILTCGDYTGAVDIDGAVAIGGTLDIPGGFSIGFKAPLDDPDAHAINPEVGETMTIAYANNINFQPGAGGQFYGNVVTVQPVTIPTGVTLVEGGMPSNGDPLGLAAKCDDMQLRSQYICNADGGSNGAAPIPLQKWWGEYHVSVYQSGTNLFEIDAQSLSGSTTIIIDNPNGLDADVVVNVVSASGTDAVVLEMGEVRLSDISAESVLFNFCGVPNLDMTIYGFKGSILAPLTAVTFSNGQIDGSLGVASLEGSAELHLAPFTAVMTLVSSVCPTLTASCNDGLQNQGEDDTDCGGPNCAACVEVVPTCTDGLENGNEAGQDCGAPGDFTNLAPALGGVLSIGYTITDDGLVGGHVDNGAFIYGITPNVALALSPALEAAYGPFPFASNYVYGMNNLGQAVGVYPTSMGWRGFLYDAELGLQPLPAVLGNALIANSGQLRVINDAGSMGGFFGGVLNQAFVYDAPSDTLTDIAAIAGNWWTSVVNGINVGGTVVGYYQGGSHQIDFNHAFTYGGNPPTLVDLDGILVAHFGGVVSGGSDAPESVAMDINDAGIVVGTYDQRPYSYDSNTGVVTELTTVGFGCSPTAINESGWITGHCATGPFVYYPDSDIVRHLPGGGNSYDINEQGWVTGKRQNAAFIWVPHSADSACAPCTGTCGDFLINQGETGVDCGGPCTACPTCQDGIKNQGELAVDCGGPCAPCVTDCDYINQGAGWAMPANAPNCGATGRYLTGVDLTGANLAGSNFYDGAMTYSNLTNANLTNANLTFMNLTGSNFTGANLTGADLSNSSLGSVIWASATCPDGVVVDGASVTTCIGHL